MKIWLLNRLKRWSNNPDDPYYDEDGTENEGPVQEAIFANLNDDMTQEADGPCLLGTPENKKDAKVKEIKVEAPLHIDTDYTLRIGPTPEILFGDSWVLTDEYNNKAILDLDFENRRFWYNGSLYPKFADVIAAVGAGIDNGDGTYTLGPVDDVPFTGYNINAGTIISEYTNATSDPGRFLYAIQQVGDDTRYTRVMTITPGGNIPAASLTVGSPRIALAYIGRQGLIEAIPLEVGSPSFGAPGGVVLAVPITTFSPRFSPAVMGTPGVVVAVPLQTDPAYLFQAPKFTRISAIATVAAPEVALGTYRSYVVTNNGFVQARVNALSETVNAPDTLLYHPRYHTFGFRYRCCDVYSARDFSTHINGEFIGSTQTSRFVSNARADVSLMIGHLANKQKISGTVHRFAYFPRTVPSDRRMWLSCKNPEKFLCNGARVWFVTPYSVLLGGNKQLSGGVTSFNGDIVAGGGATQPFVLNDRIFPRDDHNSPAFLRLASGKIMTHYSGHTLPNHYQRITTNVPDETHPPIWGDEVDLGPQFAASSSGYAYAGLVQMGNGEVYCFVRCRHVTNGTLWWTWHYSISTDEGLTWTQVQCLFTAGENIRSYTRVWKTSDTRIDIACNDGSPAEYPQGTSQYHCYYDTSDRKFRTSDGNDLGPPPFVPTDVLTRVYDGRVSSSSRDGAAAWVWDIKTNNTGNPVIVFSEILNGFDHRYWYAFWTGNQWVKEEICAQGATLYPVTNADELWYSGGIVIDPDDVNTIYCSRETGGDIVWLSYSASTPLIQSGAGGVNTNTDHWHHGVFQLWKGRRFGAARWELTQLTFGAEDCVRPDKIAGASVTYSIGRYPNYFYYGLRIEQLDPIAYAYKPPIDYINGYQSLSYNEFPKTDFIVEYRARYTVPEEPVEQPWDASNLYIFISTQDILNNRPSGQKLVLLQPVLQYGSYSSATQEEIGGEFWSIANWVLFNGRFYIGESVEVATGDTLTAKIKRNGLGDYTVSVEEHPEINLHMTGLPTTYEQRMAGVAFESYGIANWDQNPGPIDIQILNLKLAATGDNAVINFFQYPAKSGTITTVTKNRTPTPRVRIVPRRS